MNERSLTMLEDDNKNSQQHNSNSNKDALNDKKEFVPRLEIKKQQRESKKKQGSNHNFILIIITISKRGNI